MDSELKENFAAEWCKEKERRSSGCLWRRKVLPPPAAEPFPGCHPLWDAASCPHILPGHLRDPRDEFVLRSWPCGALPAFPLAQQPVSKCRSCFRDEFILSVQHLPISPRILVERSHLLGKCLSVGSTDGRMRDH